jgi:hypothetical protein
MEATMMIYKEIEMLRDKKDKEVAKRYYNKPKDSDKED